MILVCGEALIDLFVDPPARDRLTTEAVAGGSPFNVAVGLARLGRPVGFLSSVSEDAFGAFLTGRLTSAGVSGEYLRRCSEHSTLSVVATDSHGHPHYAFYAEAGADRALAIHDLPSSLPASINAIAAGSYALGVEPIAGAIETLLVREAHRAISLDPNVRPRVVGDVPAFRDRFERLLPIATIVKGSVEDLALFYGECDVHEIARNWIARGPSLVVLTRGADGPMAMMRDGTVVSRAAHPVEVADTVGAGDSFHAALLAYLDRAEQLTPGAVAALTPSEVSDALDFAAVAAAITCTRRGADTPTWPEVEDLMRTGSQSGTAVRP